MTSIIKLYLISKFFKKKFIKYLLKCHITFRAENSVYEQMSNNGDRLFFLQKLQDNLLFHDTIHCIETYILHCRSELLVLHNERLTL